MTERQLPTLSVCIPTKNAAETLERCLESIQPIADEIVVLDSDSTDGTVEICRQYGADVRQYEFTGFAELRRTQLEAASNDWVLLLDSDEVLSDELVTELADKFSEQEDLAAIYLPKTVRMFGSWVRIGRDPLPWLARKDALQFTGNYVHERPKVKSEFKEQTSTCSSTIRHYSFETVSNYLRKADQYTSLEALEAVESDQTPTFPQYLLKAFLVFWSRLLLHKGILDGFAGVFFSFASAQYELITYGKILELRQLRSEQPDRWKDIWIEERCQRW